MPGGRSGLFPGVEKLHQSAEYKQREAEDELLRSVGRDRMLELAKAEKDGRLEILPCKLGGTVYANFSLRGSYLREKNKPYPCKVVFIGISKEPVMHIQFESGQVFPVDFEKIGKTVFTTKEAAEVALRERGVQTAENKFKCRAEDGGYCKKWLRECVGWENCGLEGYGAPCPLCENSSPVDNERCATCKHETWKKENYIP